jgi:chaperonin GroEL
MKAKQKPGVVFQPHVHHALQRGIHQMVSAIRPTLGPLSGGVAIEPIHESESLPEYLDDGGLIARRIIELANRDEDMGGMLVRSMIIRQHERVGDGTATTAVLFEAIFNAGVRYIAAGGNAMQMRRVLENTLPLLLDELDHMAFRLEGQQSLTNMARSLCHDDEMAELMGEAFDLIGDYGRLDIREDYGSVLRLEYVEGSYFQSGLFSRVLLPEDSVAKVTLENPAVFLCDFEIDDHRELFPLLQTANEAKVNGLVLVARNLSDKVISLLVAHNKMDKFKIMALKLPGLSATERMTSLDDLSILTGATPFLKITGDSIERVSTKHLGSARRVWADSRQFGIVGGGGQPIKLRQHLQTLKTHHQRADDVEEIKALQERIANLMNGSVTLWVGGFTRPEIDTRKRLAQRTALILRAAVQSGVVPGGGMAFLKCRDLLDKRYRQSTDVDERAALRSLSDALAAPARTIYQNAGYDPGEVFGQLRGECPTEGFDVMTDRVVDLCEAGIMDSLHVLKHSLSSAVRTAALALTIDSLVHLSAPEMIGKPS